MAEKTLEEILISEFQNPDFKEDEDIEFLFGFRPDLILKSDNEVKAFVIRRGNSIPEEFIKRFSAVIEIENYSIHRFIAFSSKPDYKLVDTCLNTYNVNVCYLSGETLAIEKPEPNVQEPQILAVQPYVMPQ